ncbi:hypothetical protein BX070DRAFT_224057 [Coemansia spiralis]|nr:hypothetical protein BX070DRAFT_224057 [Coemansia spiralis]
MHFGRHLQPFYCKYRVSSYVNQQYTDKRLTRNLRAEFGNDVVIIMRAGRFQRLYSMSQSRVLDVANTTR